jgi:hypothetical protein
LYASLDGRRCFDYWFGFSRALLGRELGALLAPEPSQQKESPSLARALTSLLDGRCARS